MKAILDNKRVVHKYNRMWLAISDPKTIEQKMQKLIVMLWIKPTENTRKWLWEKSKIEILNKLSELQWYLSTPKT